MRPFGFLFSAIGFPALTSFHPKYTRRFIHKTYPLTYSQIGDNIMGYAVDYISTEERKRRKVKKKYRREHVTSKAIRAKDMKNAVKSTRRPTRTATMPCSS